jgi:hypothetical protein
MFTLLYRTVMIGLSLMVGALAVCAVILMAYMFFVFLLGILKLLWFLFLPIFLILVISKFLGRKKC